MVPHFGTICVQGRTDACMGCSDQISERRCYSHLGYWCFYYLYSSAREGVDSSLYGSTSSVALPTLSWNVGRLALQDILYMLQALAVVYRYKIQHWIWKFSVKKNLNTDLMNSGSLENFRMYAFFSSSRCLTLHSCSIPVFFNSEWRSCTTVLSKQHSGSWWNTFAFATL